MVEPADNNIWVRNKMISIIISYNFQESEQIGLCMKLFQLFIKLGMSPDVAFDNSTLWKTIGLSSLTKQYSLTAYKKIKSFNKPPSVITIIKLSSSSNWWIPSTTRRKLQFTPSSDILDREKNFAQSARKDSQVKTGVSTARLSERAAPVKKPLV